jgi:hypothetical protein
MHLIKTLKGLTQLKYSMSTEGPMVESVVKLITNRLASKETIQNFTLDSHNELISALNIEAGNMTRIQSQNGYQLLRVVSMHWQIFDRLIQMWMRESKLAEEQLAKLRKEPITEIMTKVNEMIAKRNELLKEEDRMPLIKPDIYYAEQYKEQVKEILSKHDLGNKVYQRDKSDYDSQFDLIKSLLLGGD